MSLRDSSLHDPCRPKNSSKSNYKGIRRPKDAVAIDLYEMFITTGMQDLLCLRGRGIPDELTVIQLTEIVLFFVTVFIT